jgi:hypothetical protein
MACWWQPVPRPELKSVMRTVTLQPRPLMLSPFEALTNRPAVLTPLTS